MQEVNAPYLSSVKKKKRPPKYPLPLPCIPGDLGSPAQAFVERLQPQRVHINTMATNSIYDLKKGFLFSQLRILNGPLDPPRDWQEQIPEGEDGDLPEVVVDQVLYKRRQFIIHLCPLFSTLQFSASGGFFFPFFRKKKTPPPRVEYGLP